MLLLAQAAPCENMSDKDLAGLKVDDRYRVVLDKEIREKLKAAPGDKVLAIPRTNSTVGAEIARLRHIAFACKPFS